MKKLIYIFPIVTLISLYFNTCFAFSSESVNYYDGSYSKVLSCKVQQYVIKLDLAKDGKELVFK